jgi:hypothetical protein
MAILGGSPLGLIGSRSRPETSGKSSFPFDGASIGVQRYNQSNDVFRTYTPSKTVKDNKEERFEPSAPGPQNKSSISIFSSTTRPNRFTPFPNFDKKAAPKDDLPNISENGLSPSRLHRDDLYDTSILNILNQLRGTRAELRASHFAYLKNVGVFPNNRLMIARRFESSGASVTNILRKGSPAMSVMISWVPQDADFFTIGFGEEWMAAEVDFTAVLNDLGNDFTKASGLGDKMGGGLGVIPLPGFTETIQRYVLEKMGIMSDGSSSFIPAGEPNLIKEAKRRKTIGYSEAGSGLKASFTVKMTCEWEQKFISGLDPTIVWLDIVQQCLRFGTSNSVTYGLSGGFEAKIMRYVNNPMLMLYDLIDAIKSGINKIKAEIKKLFDKAIAAVGPKPETPKEQQESNAKAEAEAEKKSLNEKMADIFSTLEAGATALLKRIIGKYKVRIEGILHALVGSPSGPWHITIGNPMRPVFSSGDMVISDMVNLTFGSTLAFNDLPSTIKAEFTLTPARNLGLQEIFARFNSGHVRSVLAYPTQAEKETFAKALGIDVEGDSYTPDPDRSSQANQDQQESASAKLNKSVDDKINEYYGNPPKDNPPPYYGPSSQLNYRDESPSRANGQSSPDKNTNTNVSNSQAETTTTTTTVAPSATTTTTTVNPNSLNPKQEETKTKFSMVQNNTTNSDANGPTFNESTSTLGPKKADGSF